MKKWFFSKQLLWFKERLFHYVIESVLLLSPSVFVLGFSFYLKDYFELTVGSLALVTLVIALMLRLLFEKRLKKNFAQLIKVKMKKLGVQKPEDFERLVKSYRMMVEKFKKDNQKILGDQKRKIEVLQKMYHDAKRQIGSLSSQMDTKLQQMRTAYLEFEDLRQEYDRFQEEVTQWKKHSQDEVNQKESLLKEYQQTISEQREILEKKQDYITHLETKVHDLMQEIKEILQMEQCADSWISEPTQTTELTTFYEQKTYQRKPLDLSSQLQSYVERIENFSTIGFQSDVDRSTRSLFDSYALDLRRLFECLREETKCGVFVYSPLEKRLLFVNHFVRFSLGWSPEKFMKSFPTLLLKGQAGLSQAIKDLAPGKEEQINLCFKSKEGQERGFKCCLKSISQGPFTDQVIGIFSESR